MKRFLRAVLSAAVIVMTLNITGCDNGKVIDGITSSIGLEKSYVVLDENKIDKSEILSYESPYKDAAASYYKDQLNDEEKELYDVFVYAYENKYSKIKYYSSNSHLGESYKKIVQCICAENPFIDWNQEYTYTYGSGCYDFTSTQLDRKDVDLKVQAYNKAKQIVQSIPQGASAYDKVSWIYNYVVNNVSYVTDSNSYLQGSPSFIYDALFGGKTQCTGFSDTMTMMCNLAGVQCITECGKTDEGHAWNLVNLDGHFYYCDATSDSIVKSELPQKDKNLFLSFLKSDEIFSANGYSLIDNVVIDFPKAEDKKYDYTNVDFNLANLSQESDLAKIAEKLMNGSSYAVVHLQSISADDSSDIQGAANYILNYISKHMTSSGYRYVTIQNLISQSSNDVVFFVNFEK